MKWKIYYRAHVTGNPLLGIVTADSEREAAIKAVALGMNRMGDVRAFKDVTDAALSVLVTDYERLMEAGALLMREIICEVIFRRRCAWDPEHPNRSIGIRNIKPDGISRWVHLGIFHMSSAELRSYAARVLDEFDPDGAATSQPKGGG